jgi:hypothetical protein
MILGREFRRPHQTTRSKSPQAEQSSVEHGVDGDAERDRQHDHYYGCDEGRAGDEVERIGQHEGRHFGLWAGGVAT